MGEVCRERVSLTTTVPSGDDTKKGTRARTRPVEEGDMVGNAETRGARGTGEGMGGIREGGAGSGMCTSECVLCVESCGRVV